MTEPPFLSSLRDVGASINKSVGSKLIATGRLYVSAALDNATDEDNKLLRNDYNLKTIVSTEQSLDVGAKPTKIGASGSILSSRFLGITRCRINLRSAKYTKNVRARLSCWNVCKIFFSLFTFDLENPSVTESVTDAMWVHGPIGETLEVLDTGIEQICDLFKALLCNTSSYPLLICGGKWMREQNLLIVLILLVLRVPVEHISADYVSCVQGLQTDKGCFKSKGEADLVRAMVEKKAEWIPAIRNHLDDRYSGVEAYLTQGGVTLKEIGSLREALQASSSRVEVHDKDGYKIAECL